MAQAYADHLGAVTDLLRRRSCFEVLDLRYEEVLDRSDRAGGAPRRFVGGIARCGSAMAAVVDRGAVSQPPMSAMGVASARDLGDRRLARQRGDAGWRQA